jgi:dTDP-4-dehydrorhamnose reductase
LHILVLGAAGMVGRKLSERLLADGRLGQHDITRLTLQDVVAPSQPAKAGFPVDTVTCDFAVAGAAERLVADRPDVIFHLAAIVSGEAEQDFDKGYRINLDGTRMLLDAIRLIGGGYKPRVVFTSSIAVFGAPFPDKIGDEFFHTPLLSYGTQKAIDELLLADYSRRGFMDGIGIRLPTICVRPGLPNKAASGFFSNILREPLAGKDVVLPVSEDVALGGRLPAARRDPRFPGGRSAPQPHHARPVGDGRRADRGAEAGGGRQGRSKDQARTGSLHHRHRRRLAARFRAEAGARTRLHDRRKDLRRHHPDSHRG